MSKQNQNLNTVGKQLRRRREQLGYAYDQVAAATHLSIATLKAIEQDDYQHFPSATQVVGMVRIYARYLEVDLPPLLALLRRDYEQAETANRGTRSQLAGMLFTSPKRKIAWVVVGLLLIVGVTGMVLWQLDSLLTPPSLQITDPLLTEAYVGKGELEIAAEKDRITLTGIVDANTAVTLNGQVLPTTALREFTTPLLPLPQERNVFALQARNQFGRTTEVEIVINRLTTDLPTAEIILDNKSTDRVTLTAVTDSDVRELSIEPLSEVKLQVATSFQIIEVIGENLTIIVNDEVVELDVQQIDLQINDGELATDSQ